MSPQKACQSRWKRQIRKLDYFTQGYTPIAARKVRKKRKELSLSEEELAWRANISDRELRNIEHGKVNPKLDSVISLCVQLSIDIGELALIYPVEAIEYV